MKIVVNRCLGGFSLSPKAVALLSELRGEKAYFFVSALRGRLRQVPIEEVSGMFWIAYNTPTPESAQLVGEWCDLSLEERKAINEKSSKEMISIRPDDRADPLLVQVVEELGEDANGGCAKLSVVEIPDGVDWEIDEYDGMETIHEKHRSW